MTAEQAVAALYNATCWPGLLELEPGIEASQTGERWMLRQGGCSAEVSESGVRGRWATRPGQGQVQLLLATVLAGLGLYNVAYSAKIPLTVVAGLCQLVSPLLAVAVVTLLVCLLGFYLVDFVGVSLLPALTVDEVELPDAGTWRHPLVLLAVGLAVYACDAGAGALQRQRFDPLLVFHLVMTLVGVVAACHLCGLGWRAYALAALWAGYFLLIAFAPLLGVAATIPLLVIGVRRMVATLGGGPALRARTDSTSERIFWLVVWLFAFVSFGALLGNSLYWASAPWHGTTDDDIAKQWWVAGATLGTLLALLVAPVGPLKLPLFVASSLYQALLAWIGAWAALLGSAISIFLSIWRVDGAGFALKQAVSYSLFESGGRLLGAGLGLFFLGYEGAAVGAALCERIMGAWSLLHGEEEKNS